MCSSIQMTFSTPPHKPRASYMLSKLSMYLATLLGPLPFFFYSEKGFHSPAWPPICNPLALALQVAGITPVHHHAWLALVLLQFIYVSTEDTRLTFKECIHFSFKNASYIFCFSNLVQLNSCLFGLKTLGCQFQLCHNQIDGHTVNK